MPTIIPILTIDGRDESGYLISAHSEQTANSTKDANKYDLVLANVGGRYTGRFAPKNLDQLEREELEVAEAEAGYNFQFAPKRKVGLKVKVIKQGCEGTEERIIDIFSGEIQAAEADDLYCRIEGSCSQGGMTSRIHPKIYKKDIPIKAIVNDLLDDFGYTGVRHIHPAKNSVDDENPSLGQSIDFDTAMYEVSCWAQSIYFFDEFDEFWFVPAIDFRGFSNLTGKVMRGSNASNMVGYANIVHVFGGTIGGDIDPATGEPIHINERKTHSLIYAEARAPDVDIANYGEMLAPPVIVPNADQARCQEIADNLLEQYRQYKDVPTVKVSGVAPGLLAKVAYRPWNGAMPPVRCDGVEEAEMGPIMGLVTRRVCDISAENGFTCLLDVSTNFYGVNKPDGYEDKHNFYALNRAAIDADPGIITQYPGVLFA